MPNYYLKQVKMNVEKEKYHPEPYWSEVAERIESREEHNVIAGDDEPYYRYKRQEFLRLLSKLDFNGKNVLELGAGPGGNIEAVLEKYTPKSITDADISDAMLRIAQKNITNPIVHFVKTNGTTLPFQASKFDLTYTATVLQHNTDAIMLKQIIAELCRVSSDKHSLVVRAASPSSSPPIGSKNTSGEAMPGTKSRRPASDR